MNRTKLFVVGTAFVALIVLFVFSQNMLNPSGFFGLSVEEETQLETEDGKNTVEQENVSAGISFEVLEPTTIEAGIVGEAILPDCPEETEFEVLVKNTGNGIAEKVYFSFGSGVKVVGCSNCSLDKLLPKQEITAKTRLCLESDLTQAISVGSANSNIIELAVTPG